MSQKLIAEIKKRWSPQDSRCGRLIQIQRHFSIWHYGVALSDSWGISWGPKGMAVLHAHGRLKVERMNPNKYRKTRSIVHLQLPRIYENLIASATAFHRKWHYDVAGWNCEHWARLITTAKAKSYQIKKTPLKIVGAHHNRDAKKCLSKHRKLVLLVRQVRNA